MPGQIIELNLSVWWLKDLLMGSNSQSSVSELWGDPDYKTVYTDTGSWQICLKVQKYHCPFFYDIPFQAAKTAFPQPVQLA